MYYHLSEQLISLHAVGTWLMRADERTDTDWETLEDCLRGRTLDRRAAQFGELVHCEQQCHRYGLLISIRSYK